MKKASLISVLLCTIGMLYLIVTLKYYERERLIIESDAIHYYSYIPAALVYHDMSQGYLNEDIGAAKYYFFTNVKLPDGRFYFKTTMGVALLESVFIAPLHFILKITGGPATGVSVPYRAGILFCALFYFMAGLMIVRHLLIHRFKIKDSVAALTILAVGVATNITIYVIREPGMSHVYSFFSIILFVYLLDKLVHKTSLKNAFLTGIVAGLIVLIRPVNIVVLVLFITWNIGSFRELADRILLFIRKPALTGLLIAGAILIWIPQLAYYYYLTGSIFFSGYGEETKFFLDNPQLVNNLFSYRKGWFLYTPVMLFAIIGLIPMYFKNRNYFWPVLSVGLILIYLNSSWYSWWFGGGYGQRAYIDIYGILAIPLAYFIGMIWSRYIVTKALTVLLIFTLIFHNIFQTFQYLHGAVHYFGMTKEAYWYSFGKLYPGVRQIALLEFPDYELARKGIYPKPESKMKSEQEWIDYLVKRFSEDPAMMGFLKEKAASSGKTIETQIHDDATWILKADRAYFECVINSDWKSKEIN